MKKIIALVLMLTVIIFSGCSREKFTAHTGLTAGQDIISPALLSGASLKLDWQNGIPLAAGEKIRHLVVAEQYAYVMTDLNTVFCYDRMTGKLRFLKQFARPNLPVIAPAEYDGAMYVVIGYELWKIDPKTAVISLDRRLENSAVCPVVVTQDSMYISGLDNRISCYDLKGNWLKFQVTADSDSRITAVTVDNEFMWFATEKGNIHCSSAYDQSKKWSFNTTSHIKGSIIKHDKFIYVSCEDTMLYKLNAITGSLAWKAHLGSALTESPIVYDDIVCQKSNLNGIYGIDTETGKIRWQEPDGKSFAARNGSLFYLFTNDNLLSIIDSRSGKPNAKVNFSPVELCGKNLFDGNIYALGKDDKLAKISKK